MKKAIMAAAALTIGISGWQPIAAQDGMVDLGNVIVTATRTAEDPTRVPASVSVVTEKEMQERPLNNVTDSLAKLPGVYQEPIAGNNVSIRGFSGSDLLVLLDGQPLNSGWGGDVEWQALPTHDIEKIEVVKGAASSLYGGRAVGGVINIITKGHKDGFSGNISTSYGSDNTKKTAVNASVGNEKYDFGIGYERRKTDGFPGYFIDKKTKNKGTATVYADLPESARGRYVVGGRGNKAFNTETYSARFGYHFNEDSSLTYRYTRTHHTYVYDNPFSFVRDQDGNQIFEGTVGLPNGKFVTFKPTDFLGYVGEYEMQSHRFAFEDTKHLIHATFGLTDYTKDGYSSTGGGPEHPTAADMQTWNGPGAYSFYPSKSYDVDIHKTWELDRHDITAGINYNREEFEQTRYTSLHWRDHDHGLTPYEYNGGRGTIWALYLQDKFQWTDDFTLYAGLRYDRYEKSDGYTRRIKDGQLTEDHEFDKGKYTEISPKVALEYRLDDLSSVYASYGHSFTPPKLNQVYRASGMPGKAGVVPNPDLGPETTDTFELGWKRHDDQNDVTVALFRSKTKDLIKYTYHYLPLQPGQTKKEVDFKRYENSEDEMTREGVELGWNHKLDENWSTYINYTYQKAEIEDETYYYIPKHLLHFGVTYDRDQWRLLLDGVYVSERQSPDDVTGEYKSEDGYFLMNLSANYEWKPGLIVQASVYNIMDRQFYATEAARGRSYQIGVSYQF